MSSKCIPKIVNLLLHKPGKDKNLLTQHLRFLRKNFKKIQLEVEKINEGAWKLYEREGFKLKGEFEIDGEVWQNPSFFEDYNLIFKGLSL